MKYLLILLAMVQIAARSKPPVSGLLLIEADQPQSARLFMNDRTTVKLDLSKFSLSSFTFLKTLNRRWVSVHTTGKRVDIFRFDAIDGSDSSFVVQSDGAGTFARIQVENGVYYIPLKTAGGVLKRLILKGPITEPKLIADFLNDPDVWLEGFLRDEGASLQITKLTKQETKPDGTPLLLSGTLHRGRNEYDGKNGYYVEGPVERETWLRDVKGYNIEDMLGGQVLVLGKDLIGRAAVDTIEPVAEIDNEDASCASSLMDQFLFDRNRMIPKTKKP